MKKEIQIAGNIIENSKCQKLLRIKINSKLSINAHVEDLCEKAKRKMHAPARTTPYVDLPKKRILFSSAFFKYQFSYCPLAWMHHSRRLNYRKNTFDQRCVPTMYNDKQVTFKELLDKDISV